MTTIKNNEKIMKNNRKRKDNERGEEGNLSMNTNYTI
jgi:hypothetical protein